ncbi:MAG: topoisomerase C-terminal repeat-containing protein, partial [Fimbriimonadales bacterium]
AYIQCGDEIRNLESWRDALEIGLEEAVRLLAQPKTRRGAVRRAPAEPIQAFETPAGAVRVLEGRYGPYVTDGKVNATLPKGTDPKTITQEEAVRLLEAKRAAGPSPRRRTASRRRPAR